MDLLSDEEQDMQSDLLLPLFYRFPVQQLLGLVRLQTPPIRVVRDLIGLEN
tara:strand:- start:14726 stop:14878 length:153 start_codon:yes stop_codon:yes gene_type:complete